MLLQVGRPFRAGDQITSGVVDGVVIGVDWRTGRSGTCTGMTQRVLSLAPQARRQRVSTSIADAGGH